MKMRYFSLVIVIVLALIAFSCTLETPSSTGSSVSTSGSDLVINEVFHISPDKYYTYSWIELYNPTHEQMYWYKQNQIDDSTKVTQQVLIRFLARVKIYNIDNATGIGNPSYIVAETTLVAYFSNYHHEFAFVGRRLVLQGAYFSALDNVIFPGQFVVVVNSKDAFTRHTDAGPFGPVILEPKFPGQSIQGTTQPAFLVNGRNPFDPFDPQLYWFTAPGFWDLLDANEVSLIRIVDTVNTRTGAKIENTNVIDVARYGNYHPSPDPFPNNIPLPYNPLRDEGKSVARYGGYYATGNSIEDFYLSPDPIPGWYSQRRK